MRLTELRRYLEPKPPQTLEEAVARLKSLEEQIGGAQDARRRLSEDEVYWRLEQGKLLEDCKRFFRHGEGGADVLAGKAGIHVNTLRDAGYVYRRAGSMGAFRMQVERWKAANQKVTWSMVRTWGRGSSTEERDEAEGTIPAQYDRLKKEAKRLERKLEELAEQAADLPAGQQAEARDALMTAEEVALTVEGTDLNLLTERKKRQGYLEYIQEQSCVNCRSTPSLPHYLDPVGEPPETRAYFAVPLCAECTGHLAQIGPKAVWGGESPWKYAFPILLRYLGLEWETAFRLLVRLHDARPHPTDDRPQPRDRPHSAARARRRSARLQSPSPGGRGGA